MLSVLLLMLSTPFRALSAAFEAFCKTELNKSRALNMYSTPFIIYLLQLLFFGCNPGGQPSSPIVRLLVARHHSPGSILIGSTLSRPNHSHPTVQPRLKVF